MTHAPILKWAGGKRRQAAKIADLLCAYGERQVYCEPFLGAGAVALELPLSKFGTTITADASPFAQLWWASLSAPDWNTPSFLFLTSSRELCGEGGYDAYQACVDRLNAWLSQPDLGAPVRLAPELVAATLWSLNKNGFNGFVRFNKKGKFNVPWSHSEKVKAPPTQEAVDRHRELATRMTFCSDAHAALLRLEATSSLDLTAVYVDPPYVGTFDGYSGRGWSAEDAQRLFQRLEVLTERGALVLVSEHMGDHIPRHWQIVHLWERPGTISARGTGRQAVPEAVYRVRV